MNKKTVSIIGMVCGAVIILLGILVMAGSMGGGASTASGASYLYDSGYATFGADFYTYVSNNAAEAASASRVVASNLKAIAELLKNACGILIMAVGLFTTCYFGVKLTECKAEVKTDKAPDAEPALEMPELEAETEPAVEPQEAETEPAAEPQEQEEAVAPAEE